MAALVRSDASLLVFLLARPGLGSALRHLRHVAGPARNVPLHVAVHSALRGEAPGDIRGARYPVGVSAALNEPDPEPDP